MEPSNFYAPPDIDAAASVSATSTAEHPLARRWARFLARLIDNLAIGGPGLVVAGLFYKNGLIDERAVSAAYAIVVAMIVVQAVLIARYGQSLGKLATKIRIEVDDGALPGFTRGVLLREMPFLVVASLPVVSNLMCLVITTADAVLIFREDRRCLHDVIAGTRVVTLDPSRS